jgi:hypothetical protein
MKPPKICGLPRINENPIRYQIFPVKFEACTSPNAIEEHQKKYLKYLTINGSTFIFFNR